MKLKLLLCACIALLASCSLSPEEQAKKTIEAELKKQLYFPDSYEHIETTLIQDSVMSSSLFNPDAYTLINEFKQLYRLLEENERKMKDAERRMETYKRFGEYGKVEYRQAKEEYEKYTNHLANIQEKGRSAVAKLQELQQKPYFFGSAYQIRYRAKNNSGNILLGSSIFILNEDKTKILASYSDDELEEINAFKQELESLPSLQP